MLTDKFLATYRNDRFEIGTQGDEQVGEILRSFYIATQTDKFDPTISFFACFGLKPRN